MCDFGGVGGADIPFFIPVARSLQPYVSLYKTVKRMKLVKKSHAALMGLLLFAAAMSPSARAQAAAEQTGTVAEGSANTSAEMKDSLQLTLTQALEIALSEHPNIRIADRNVQIKQEAKKEKLAALIPAIKAEGSFNRTLKKQVMAMEMNGQTMEIAVGMDNTYNGGLTLSLPLVAPALWRTVQLSEQEIALAVETARADKITLVENVKKAYYSLLLAQDSYQVLLQNYQNVEANTRNVAAKFEKGLVSEFEKLRAEVNLKNQRPALVAARAGVRLAEVFLKATIGLDVEEPVVFMGTLADFESSVPQDVARYQLLANFSLQNNPNLVQMDLQRKQLEQTLRLTKASYLPTLAVGVNYTYMAMANHFRFGDYHWNPYAVAAFQLSIPIFSGLKKQRQVRQMQLGIQNLEDTRVGVERNLKASLQGNLDQIVNAVEELESNKENIAMAQKAYAISTRQYEVGMSTWLDLSQAELALTSAQLAYSQSIYNYLTAAAALESTLGNNYNE